MARKMIFRNGEEMLSALMDGKDLYNAETGQYVFNYNECGSIAVYYLSSDRAEELKELSKEHEEYWGAFLGPGGYIYDDPSYEDFDEEWSCSNLDWCKEYYQGVWEDVSVHAS